MPLSANCQCWCMKFKAFLLHYHHDGSPWQVCSWTCHHSCWGWSIKCQHCRWTVRCSKVYCKSMATEIPEGWASWKVQRNWVMACIQPPQDPVLVAEAQRNPFISARDLKAAIDFPGQKRTVISRLKEAGLRAWHTKVKEVQTDEHKLYCLLFAESSVDRK